MPKFGTHIVIGEEVAKKLGQNHWVADVGDVGNALRLGAVGPDLTLFLFDPGAGDPKNGFVFKALQQGLDTYGEIRKLRDKLQELDDYMGAPPKDLADWFTGGFSTSMLETLGLSIHAFFSALKVVVYFDSTLTVTNPLADLPQGIRQLLNGQGKFPEVDLPSFDFTPKLDPDDVTAPGYIFRYFGGPYTDDPPYKKGCRVGDYSEWWWMDVLHYRRTTEFALRLMDLARASGSEVQMAYAVGYMSHVGADIVGHPYVNSMVGGPFRSHALRHMVIESLLDVHVWISRKGEEIINSRLDKKVSLSTEARNEICNLFNRALIDVYVNPVDGSDPIVTKNFERQAPSAGDLSFAYEVMAGYLAFSTDVDLQPPVRPPDSLGALWDEIRESIERTVDEIDKYVRDLRTKSGWDWLAALIGLVMWSAVLLVKILTLPAAVIARIAAIAPRWLLYLVNSALYDFVRNVRYAMALCGWGYAGAADLGRGPSKDLLTIRSPLDDDRYVYPYAMTPRRSGFWLEYPTRMRAQLEEPRTFAGPYRQNSSPDDFIDRNPFDYVHRPELEELASPPPLGSAQGTTAKIFSMVWEGPAPGHNTFFGNAVDFSVMLLNQTYPEGQFDLDGDRGYGFLQWEAYPPASEYIK